LSRALAPGAKYGILEVLAGKALLEDAIWKDPPTGMDFLPAVARARLAHSNEILGSGALNKLFDRLRASYDYVVVDLSPLAPIVDVRATTDLVDSYVLVIEWGRTKIDVVEQVLREAQGVYQNLLGAVLNKADIKLLSRYDGNRGSYYHNKHYARYGYLE